MDEVLAVGDMAFQRKCLDKMREAAEQEGRTVLYVSHNMNTIRRLCDRCIVLDQGRVIYDGEVEKGIAVYMDHSLGENEVDMELDSGLRRDLGLFMRHLTLPDKVTPVYEQGEPMRLCLTVETTKPLDGVIFRLTLRTDGDVGLGTSWSEKLRFVAPGTHTVTLSLPMDSVAKGVFYASIGFFRTDELGRYMQLDHITRAFKLELLGTPAWNTNAFGYIRLPEAREE